LVSPAKVIVITRLMLFSQRFSHFLLFVAGVIQIENAAKLS